MRYEDLDQYKGQLVACSFCHRAFIDGEAITVTRDGEALCYSDSDGGCLTGLMFKDPKARVGDPMRFGSKKVSISEQRPNYPKSGLPDGLQMVEVASVSSGFKLSSSRLLDFFRSFFS